MALDIMELGRLDEPAIQSLSVVIPTFNEVGNIVEIARRLEVALHQLDWEVIFVDDASVDGTAEIVRRIARKDRRVRLISRHNRRGLSSAVVEGALAASSDLIAVMDGDLQHDENTLPRLYEIVASGRADIASASRFISEDGTAGLSSEARVKMSNTGIRLANKSFGLNLTDPLTGFFVFRREILDRALPDISELGFKILLDLIVSSTPRPRVKEIPFTFRERHLGESKLDNRVLYDFFLFFLQKKVGSVVPVPARFLSFAMINAVGILVHFAVLFPLVGVFGMTFIVAQLSATIVAMFFNYTVNNALTYHDRRLRGGEFLTGFAVFVLLCSVGVLGNLGVSTMLQREFAALDYTVPALAGALLTVVWNYGATKAFVWGGKRRSQRRASATAQAAALSLQSSSKERPT